MAADLDAYMEAVQRALDEWAPLPPEFHRLAQFPTSWEEKWIRDERLRREREAMERWAVVWLQVLELAAKCQEWEAS